MMYRCWLNPMCWIRLLKANSKIFPFYPTKETEWNRTTEHWNSLQSFYSFSFFFSFFFFILLLLLFHYHFYSLSSKLSNLITLQYFIFQYAYLVSL